MLVHTSLRSRNPYRTMCLQYSCMMFWTILLLGLKCGQFCDTDAHLKNVRTQLGWNARDSFLCCQQMWNYFTRNVGLFKGEKGPRALHKHMRDLLPLMLNSSTYSRGRKLVMIDVGANIGQIIPFYLYLQTKSQSCSYLNLTRPISTNLFSLAATNPILLQSKRPFQNKRAQHILILNMLSIQLTSRGINMDTFQVRRVIILSRWKFTDLIP